MPRVSIIIPAYNAASFVGRAIDSALAQTFHDREIVVVNDGSTDETAHVVSSYSDKIKVVSQSNHGVSYARNVGVAHASGEFVAFLDADDRYLPGKLSRQLSAIEQSPKAGLVYCDAWEESLDGQRIGLLSPRRFRSDGYLRPLFLLQTFWLPSSVMIQRSIFDRVGGFDESLRTGEDRELWMRIAHVALIVDVNEPLVIKIRRPDSLGQTVLVSPFQQITDKMIRLVPELAPLRVRRDWKNELNWSEWYLCRGDLQMAWKHVRRALGLRPLKRKGWQLLLVWLWRTWKSSAR